MCNQNHCLKSNEEEKKKKEKKPYGGRKVGRNGNSKENAVNLSSKVTWLRWEELRCQMGGRGWREVLYPQATRWGMILIPWWGAASVSATIKPVSRHLVVVSQQVLQSCCRLFLRMRSASKAGPSARLSQKEGGRQVPTFPYALEMLLLENQGAPEKLL